MALTAASRLINALEFGGICNLQVHHIAGRFTDLCRIGICIKIQYEDAPWVFGPA